MAESEATHQGIKAVGGWSGDEEVTTYTRDAEQERLAKAAMGKAVDSLSDMGEA